MLNPASDEAAAIAGLAETMLVGAGIASVIVLALLVAGLLLGRRGGARLRGRRNSGLLVLVGGVAIPVALLFVLVGSSVSVGRGVVASSAPGALTIEVIGHRWWWEVHYTDRNNFRLVETANEIHVPVGRPVRLLLKTDNVIHSFWVPELQGKVDLVPGQVNSLVFTARKAGVYQGQCAEFCGILHAKMRFIVVAQSEPEFEQWLKQQIAPGRRASNAWLRDGRRVFRASCARCHAIRGVPGGAAAGPNAETVDGPDLTHVGSRRTLAAAVIPNTRGHMAGWIADPQSIKSGSQMPAVPLTPDELRAVVDYLHSLK